MSAAARTEPISDVVVVGGGVIGLGVAWRAAAAGLRVAVVDPAPGGATSRVAAGMLAPVTEAAYNEHALLRLNLDSAARYPEFVAELTDVSGIDTGFRTTGTVLAAVDADDLRAAEELRAFHRSLDLPTEALTSREVRRRESFLTPGLRGGLLVESDHSVDPRRLLAALAAACRAQGVEFVAAPVRGLAVAGDRAEGVVLGDGTAVAAGQVVLAAGAWSGRLDGLPTGALAELRPVKGQLLRLHVPPALRPLLTHTVRGLVHGTSIYLVPREDGELVVGATMEDKGFDTSVTAGAVHDLLRDAYELLPALHEVTLVETCAGLRPATPDHGPLLGRAHLDNLVVATGHFRNGILLAPLTADAICDVLRGGALPAVATPFRAERFATVNA
ncbi:MAG: glycine oxidase ThiO [Sporichthyaceae bacterium]